MSGSAPAAGHEALALRVEHLSVGFGPISVLRDVSFEVPRGSSLAIIGPNGSGKTVLFRALIGALPFEGSVRWEPGIKLGYVPQKLDLERDLPVTGIDFLQAKASFIEAPPGAIDQALDRVGLSLETSRRPIGSLSGGQFQRLLVAFSLLGGPDVLLLDEPLAGIDEPGQQHLNEVIRRLQEDLGLTVLLISHDLSLVYRQASRCLCLSRGRTDYGKPREILTPALLQELYGAPMGFHVHTHP